jgi:hypothetical protein
VTPEGKLAQYYMGVEYSPKDLRLGLAEASANRIGSPVDNILTYCYHYDPQTNKHSLIVARVVQLGGLVTCARWADSCWSCSAGTAGSRRRLTSRDTGNKTRDRNKGERITE